MSEMIERVARAMSARVEERITAEFAAKGLPPGWQQLNYPSQEAFVDESWPNYADQARAAIEAMREPTKDQAMAGQDGLDDCIDSDFDSDADGNTYPYTRISPSAPATVYRAMIDAALAEP